MAFALALPVRGAWIEIASDFCSLARDPSLPVRGAWIEIGILATLVKMLTTSLPVRGVWIEINISMTHLRFY